MVDVATLPGDVITPSHDGGNSLEGLADATLERIAEFFGKCVNYPDFCGFAIDEEKDGDGMPLKLTLIPCDLIGGSPTRRVAR